MPAPDDDQQPRASGEALIAATADVSTSASIEGPVRLGDGAVVQAGAVICGNVSIGCGVTVGARATLWAEPGAKLLVEDRVAIGAAALVTGPVVLGAGCRVEAGTHLSSDVPANAIVGGRPARITGYVGAARSSTVAPAGLDAIAGATIIALPEIRDLRGALAFAEVGAQLPFLPRRLFIQHSVPTREARGEHAHRQLHQLLLCVHGSVHVLADDGRQRTEVLLDRPSVGLHMPPMIWGGQFGYEPDAVLIVLASAPYDPDDYIRDYGEFRRLVGA